MKHAGKSGSASSHGYGLEIPCRWRTRLVIFHPAPMPADVLRSKNKSSEFRAAPVESGQTVRVLIENNRQAAQWTLAFLAEEADMERCTVFNQQPYRVHFGRPEEAITVPADRVEFFTTRSKQTPTQDSLTNDVVGEVSSRYGLEEQPAERMWARGPEALSDAELLSALLGNGDQKRSLQPDKTALELAHEMLHETNGLASLTQLDRFCAQRLGKAQATTLLAAVELSRRLAQAKIPRRELLDRPDLVANYLTLRYAQSDQEVMGALYLDVRNRLIAEREIFRGTLGRAAVEPRTILKEGLLRSAAGFILWHTHPSGDPSPSEEDRCFTRRISEAADLLGVRLFDHMILGSGGRWVSLGRRSA